jgi:hypothetical protein
MRASFGHCWLYCFALACAGLPAFAQDAKSPASAKKQPSYGEESKDGAKIEDKKFEVPYWDRSESFQIRAAMALIGVGRPLNALGARMAISENVPMVQGWEFFFEKTLPIHESYLAAIRDGRPLPDMRAKELIDLKVPDRGMYLAYLHALRRSNSATLEMFQHSAEENENVTYTHLAADPRFYRGKVITIKGTLKVLRQLGAPPKVLDDGIAKIYEGWIIGENKPAPPFAVAFTQLPLSKELNDPDILKGKTLSIPVTFYGYFLGNVLFPADKKRGATQKDLLCPWLIGKTLIVAEERPAIKEIVIEPTRSYEVVAYTVGTIFGIGVLIGLLNLYFRRSDHHTQSKLAQLRDKHQPFSLEDGKTDEKKGPDEDNPNGEWSARLGK